MRRRRRTRAIDAVWRIESAAAHRRARADRARRRPGRGPGAGRARRRARAVAGVGRPGQPGRLAHGHRQAPRDRPAAPQHSCSSASTRSSAASSRSRQDGAGRDLDAALDDDVGDDLLRLVFIACHPVLSTEARVALTLRLLGGLTTDEIARAFLVPEPTIAQRIVRAKRTLAEARVPFEVPARRRARRAPVVGARGHLPRSSTRATRRPPATTGCGPALCEDALRLGRILAELAPRRARGARPGRADGDPGVARRARASARRASRSCCSTRTARAGTSC